MDPQNDTQDTSLPPARGDFSRPNPETSRPINAQPVDRAGQQAAAANVIRSQIDALFGTSTATNTTTPTVAPAATAPQPASQPAVQPTAQPIVSNTSELQDTNPYDRVHNPHPQPEAEQWKTYHSAWQNYYQKYYEGYYAQQQATAQQGAAQASAHAPEDISKDEALFELRQKLLGKVRTQAKKVRKSRHFIPIAASLAVVAAFLFLQYNQILFATVNAYVTPGALEPQNIVIDPASNGEVTQESRLIIPKINVDVPVLYDVGNDHDSQMAAMAKGVAHFAIPGASSHPGEIGNTVLSGHSSNDLFDTGDYKFIFAQLEKLQKGDTFYANYKGQRYTYVITGTEVVTPKEVSKLVYPTDKPVMTLITCTPLGTSKNRLLVTAEQISPDPAKSAPAPASSANTSAEASMPGGSAPTFLERIFGAR